MKIITHMKDVDPSGNTRFMVKLPKNRLNQVYIYKYGSTKDTRPYLQLNYFTDPSLPADNLVYYWVGGFKANFYPTNPRTTEYFETNVDVTIPSFVFDSATRHMEDVTWVLWEVDPNQKYGVMITKSDYNQYVVPTYNQNNWGSPNVIAYDGETYTISAVDYQIYAIDRTPAEFISVSPV